MIKIYEDKSVEIKDLKDSGIYDEEFLINLEKGSFKILSQLDTIHKNDREFMLPILYALKNEYNTYIAYKYCGKSIQKDETLTIEVIKAEPNLLEDSPFASNRTFIENNINTNPNIVAYISQDLKRDEGFVQGLCNLTNDINLKKQIIEAYQISVIKDNIYFGKVEVLNESAFYNNSELMKKLFKENGEILDFATKNSKSIETKGLIAITDTVKDISNDNNIEVIQKESKSSNDIRYEKVLNKIQEVGENNENILLWTTAMVAQKDTIAPEKAKEMLEYSLLIMEEFQREDGQKATEVSISNRKKMIPPHILKKLYQKAEVPLESSKSHKSIEIEQRLDEYTKFYEEYGENLKKVKLEKLQTEKDNKETINTEDER